MSRSFSRLPGEPPAGRVAQVVTWTLLLVFAVALVLLFVRP